MFDCRPAGRTGAEAALQLALEWATDRAQQLGLLLAKVDIVVPTQLLLDWRPEESVNGQEQPGTPYEVALRWAWRLEPPLGTDTQHRLDGHLYADLQRRADGRGPGL